MAKLLIVEGIGEAYAQKLQGAGVGSLEALLERGASPKGREALVEGTGISDKLILRWINHADLMRIKGVGAEWSELLEAAGVDTVPELAQRRADHLRQRMAEVNGEKKVVRRLPSETQVRSWIEQAKQLPRIVTY